MKNDFKEMMRATQQEVSSRRPARARRWLKRVSSRRRRRLGKMSDDNHRAFSPDNRLSCWM